VVGLRPTSRHPNDLDASSRYERCERHRPLSCGARV